MAKIRLSTHIITDLVEASSILNFNFIRSIVGNTNSFDVVSSAAFWVARSLTSNTSIAEQVNSFEGQILRSLSTDIKIGNSVTQIVALRRSNIPLPPCGELWLLSHKGETKFKRSVLTRGDTHVINLIAYGDFPTPPSIVFAVKLGLDEKPFIVKDKNIILTITDVEDTIGIHQKVQAQIVIFPGDTALLERSRTVFYTCEIVDKQVDEVYTLEQGNFTIAADVYNYFENK